MRPVLLGLLLLALFLWVAVLLYGPFPPPNSGLAVDHIGALVVPEAKTVAGGQGRGVDEHPIVGGGDYTYLGFVWHLDQPYAQMPEAMAQGAYSVFWCESRMDDGAVGKAGELGVPQISPLHRLAMERAGLDFEDGKDRMQWAINLFEKHGWRPWSCQP